MIFHAFFHLFQLIARAESSDHLAQTLQSQLLELQKRETALKAREHHDAIVSSLKNRHEGEVHSLQQEVDRQTALARRHEAEAEGLRNKISETTRLHESMLVEKSDRIEELNSRLAETQRRLTELIAANSVIGGGPESTIGDPVKEICNLKSNLAAVTVQRNDYKKAVHDLTVRHLGLFSLFPVSDYNLSFFRMRFLS